MLIWEGLHSADGEVSLKRLKWDCRIDHLHCRMTSTQEYVNTSRRTIEAVYTFALPFDAVVTRFALETEDKKLEAVIRTQEQAEETYEKAVESGDMPALLEYADNGICTASIGSIKPKEKVVLTIVCEWMLQQVDGTVRVTIPTVIGARYSKDGSQGKLLPHQKVETSIFAEYPISAHFEFIGEQYRNAAFAAPGFSPECRFESDRAVVDIHSGFADRDLTVTASGTEPFTDAYLIADHHGYRGIALVPIPKLGELSHEVPAKSLKLSIVVDCSGSMTGAAIEEARRALLALPDVLSESDRLALTLFGSEPQPVFNRLRSCTRAFLRRDYESTVAKIEADLGGTEILAALQTAGKGELGKSDILLLTDGETWQTESCVEALHKQGQRVFILAIGHAANGEFCRTLAAVANGFVERVLPSEDMTQAVRRMVQRMRAASLSVRSLTPRFNLCRTDPIATVFAGETLALYFKFARLPGEIAALELTDGRTNYSVQGAAWKLVEDAGLLKIAANRELKSGNVDDAQKFAEEYELLSEHTSFVLVNEREADQKSLRMPVLQQIPQMQAAYQISPSILPDIWIGADKSKSSSWLSGVPEILRGREKAVLGESFKLTAPADWSDEKANSEEQHVGGFHRPGVDILNCCLPRRYELPALLYKRAEKVYLSDAIDANLRAHLAEIAEFLGIDDVTVFVVYTIWLRLKTGRTLLTPAFIYDRAVKAKLEKNDMIALFTEFETVFAESSQKEDAKQ